MQLTAPCSVPAARAALQVLGFGDLRTDQGGVPVPAGAVPQVGGKQGPTGGRGSGARGCGSGFPWLPLRGLSRVWGVGNGRDAAVGFGSPPSPAPPLRTAAPLRSLKLECEKLLSEKTEMQRHYVMVSPPRRADPPPRVPLHDLSPSPSPPRDPALKAGSQVGVDAVSLSLNFVYSLLFGLLGAPPPAPWVGAGSPPGAVGLTGLLCVKEGDGMGMGASFLLVLHLYETRCIPSKELAAPSPGCRSPLWMGAAPQSDPPSWNPRCSGTHSSGQGMGQQLPTWPRCDFFAVL